MYRKRPGGRDFRAFCRVGDRPASRLADDGAALAFAPAGLVRPGMLMFDEHGGYDLVELVERVALDAQSYDLDIEATHNFIANGIVRHNVEDSFPDALVLELAHLDRVALAQLVAHGLRSCYATDPATSLSFPRWPLECRPTSDSGF
jgi:hypothetical protein